MQKANKLQPFATKAIVVLPDHLHVIWKLPENDHDYANRWRLIKGYFTHAVIKTRLRFKKDKSGEYHLWQRRYWEHTIRDDYDLEKHIEYIHYNPVKHGYVQLP
jgi:putative transposase